MEPERGPLGGTTPGHAARRLGLRVLVGEAPALLAYALSARPDLVALLVGAGLLPALLAPIALRAEAGGDARVATWAAHAVGALAVLAAPFEMRYLAGVLSGGPAAGLDGVAGLVTRLHETPVGVVIGLVYAAAVIGAALGGVYGERAALGGHAPHLRRLWDAADGQAVVWALIGAPPTAVALFVTSAVVPSFPLSAGAVCVALLVAGMGGVLLVLAGNTVARAVTVVERAADRLDDLFDAAGT